MIGKGYGQREGILPMRLKAPVLLDRALAKSRTARPEAAPTPPANGQIQALQAASEKAWWETA